MRRVFAFALVVLTLGFIALGVWQIERRAWKLDLIAKVEARVHAAPQPPGLWAAIGPDDAYRRVRVSGTWTGGQTLTQAVTERGPGFWVMSPLKTAEGVVLINRGFAPGRDVAEPRGAATVVGLLRMSEPGGGFLRANDPAAGRWYSRDVAALARARGLDAVAPFFIDAEAIPGPAYPMGGMTVVVFRNAHLVYALTWFSLAGLSAAGLALVLRRSRG